MVLNSRIKIEQRQPLTLQQTISVILFFAFQSSQCAIIVVNPLHIPSLVAGLVGNPLPPPPPMPPVDLSKLSDEDLELLESTERSGVEGNALIFEHSLSTYSKQILKHP